MTLKNTLYGSVMVALLLSGSLLAADTKATDAKKATGLPPLTEGPE